MITFVAPLLASHGGFGFNLDPFETNIINLAIVIAGLWKFLPGFLGAILELLPQRDPLRPQRCRETSG